MISDYKVIFDIEAEKDLDDAILWYLDISEQLAQNFLAQLKNRIEDLRKFPAMFAKSDSEHIRKCNLAPFPYLVFYQIINDIVYILGIFHGYKSPKHIKSSLEERNKL